MKKFKIWWFARGIDVLAAAVLTFAFALVNALVSTACVLLFRSGVVWMQVLATALVLATIVGSLLLAK